MGEKFSVNPVTGTASFEIPIATSPGRAGVQPSLSVAFDSGAGNGPFGHGFIDPGTGERIERYVPRVEGTFVQIERRTSQDGNVYWTATTHDNVPPTAR